MESLLPKRDCKPHTNYVKQLRSFPSYLTYFLHVSSNIHFLQTPWLRSLSHHMNFTTFLFFCLDSLYHHTTINLCCQLFLTSWSTWKPKFEQKRGKKLMKKKKFSFLNHPTFAWKLHQVKKLQSTTSYDMITFNANETLLNLTRQIFGSLKLVHPSLLYS